jgi:hypothetical protein
MLVPSLKTKRMNNLLSNDNIRGDVPILNKGGLGIVNVIRKQRLQSISKRLSNNLVNNVAKTNRPKVLRKNRLHLFGNKSNKSLIQLRLKKS